MQTKTKKPMRIGIVGLIGAGKDTTADYLTNVHGFRRESFAGSLKDACSVVFGWDRGLLEGRTTQSRAWREQRDVWWSDRLGRDITPRGILQNWGTEVIRNQFHNDIWLASLENKIRESTDNIVISDCRFPNELESIRRQSGIVIRIVRGPNPDWFEDAVRANRENSVELQKQLVDRGVHISESAWAGTKFDAELNNDGSFDDLYAQIDKLLR